MDTSLSGYCLSLLLLTAITTRAQLNGTTDEEPREPRVSGRIVKLYSGAKPEPFLCAGEGFQLDPNNCAAFYRCVKERSGKFTVFRYQCAPGTVYDPDLETCNHPHSTRRVECGGTFKTTSEPYLTANINEIDESQSEIPKPISTKVPIYIEQTTFKTPTVSWVLSTERQNAPTKMPWESIYGSPNTLSTSQTKFPTSSSKELVYSTQPATSSSILPSKITLQTHSQNDEPCTSDGFMGDSENCRKFYRCVSNLRGGYAKYEFSCSESTVWDDEIQGCNHPWAVKRSKCGRSMSYDDNSVTVSTGSSTTKSLNKDSVPYSGGFGSKSNKTIQQQLQISHGSDITQTQVQISNSQNVIQNQTQINYGDKTQNGNSKFKQNQTQISYGTATSQTQTQIDYGNKGVQTQLQIDHSKDSSQLQDQETATSSTTSTTKNNNSHKNECSESGFMGDSNDCKKFYRCVDNGRGYTKYEYSCGDGTLWDPEIEACNHAWAVKNCGGKVPMKSTTQHTSSTEKSTEYTTQQIKTTTGSTTSHVPDTDDEDDVGYGNQNHQEESSPSPSTSTATTEKTSTTAQASSSTSTTTRKPNQALTECMSSGFMGDDNDCKLFYRCVDNGNGGFIKYEFKCGDGTVWDSNIEACNHAWAVKRCGGNIPSDGHKEETTTKKENTTSFENVHTTVTLVQITTQATTLLEEYDNGYGSQNHEIQESSTTKTTTTSTSSPTKEPQSDGKGSDCRSSGFMGDENDCKKFYRCVDNGNGGYIKYEFTCGQGTVWDPKIEACNHAWAVEKCGGSHSASESSGYETTSQSYTTAHSSTVAISSQATDNGKETDKPTTITSTIGTSTTTSSSSGKCSRSGFMGDSSDCKKFYRCVDNGDGTYIRYEFTCGDGTVWDSKIEACNHAWAVEKCGDGGNGETTHGPEQTTHIMHDEEQEQDSGYATPSYETSESSQSTTLTSTSSSTFSPADEAGTCKNSGFMGDTKNCKKFYRCVDNGNGEYDRYEFQCGEGTVWDGSIEACNHAWAVKNCGGSGSSTTFAQNENTTPVALSSSEHEDGHISTEKTTTTTRNPKEDISTQSTNKPQGSNGKCNSEGFYANPSDCKKFYRCVDNGNGGYTKYDFNCGDGTVWNQEIQACDHDSGDGSCTSSSSSPQSSSSHTTTHTESTTISYSTTEKETSTQKTQAPATSENQCTAEGFYAHPNDCKKFVRCVNNGNGGYTRYEFSCGDGTVWVQDIQACDHDNDIHSCNVQSEPSSTSTSQPSHTENQTSGASNSGITTSSTESTPPNKEDDEYSNDPSRDESDECTYEGYFGNKQDCRKFYRCVDNGKGGFTKYDFVCGEGTAWDSDLQTCNHINEVKSCSDSTSASNENHQTTTNKNQAETENTSSTTKATTTTTSSSESSSSSNQDICKSEGYFGNSNDCKKFYRCVDNGQGGYTKYDFTCGDGTIWDQDITTCNHPQDVSNPPCGSNQGSEDTSTSSTTTSSTTGSSSQTTSSSTESSSDNGSQNTSDCSQESSKKPSSNNITCDKAGYYAHPNDCKKFYRCVDWDGDGKRFSVFHFECGEGTIWDPSLDTCNHEESVYPQRDCQTQSQNVGGETTTEGSTSSPTEGSTSTTTTTTTEGSTTTSEPTTSEPTTQQTSSESTTTEQTTQQPTTSEIPTTQESTTSEQTTTQGPTTTQQSTTSEQTTTQQSTTSEQTTTQQSTTTEQITTQETTTREQTTQEQTTEQSTTQQTTPSESTTQESTTSAQTTQESTTTEQTTSQQTTTSEQTTQESTTSEQTTNQQSTSSEQTTQESTTSEQTTQESTTSGENTTEGSNESTTEQSGTTTQQITDGTTTAEQTDGTTATELTTEGTTEQTTDGTSTSEPTTTTDSTTTTEQTTEGTTTAESTTDQSTQTSSTESDSGDNGSTTEASSTAKDCPETDDDQYLLVCPTSFRRHPKYCNMFYQCTEDDETYEAKTAMFKCPNNTIYDESQTQCVSEDKAEKKCNGEIANKRRFKRLGSYYKDPIVADKGKQSCTTTGFFSFEKQSECAKGFLKCERSKKGELRGYVYQCPDGFIYWSISKRCEKVESVRDCKRSSNDWSGRWNIPIERHNIARS